MNDKSKVKAKVQRSVNDLASPLVGRQKFVLTSRILDFSR